MPAPDVNILMNRLIIPRLWLAVATIALLAAPLEAAQEIVTLDTRPSVTMKILLMTPDTSPKRTVLLFPGGDGRGFTERQGKARLGNNFLVRSADLFVGEGFVAAIVDVPSDQSGGMSDQFRTSKEHAEDIKKITDFLSQKWPLPIFAVGTSRGTISVAYLGASLRDPRLGGIVLTASVGQSRPNRRQLSLLDIPLHEITLPVLFVHHRNDGCWASTFNDALQLRGRTTASSKVNFIEVLGGDTPRSEPCQALSQHGFLGKEREVVKAIADWILGKPVPDQTGP